MKILNNDILKENRKLILNNSNSIVTLKISILRKAVKFCLVLAFLKTKDLDEGWIYMIESASKVRKW